MKILFYGLLFVLPFSARVVRAQSNAAAPPQLLTTNLPSAATAPPSKPDNAKTERGLAVKNAGNLFLAFPESWRDSIGRIRGFDSVKFLPREGDEFAGMVEIINVGEENVEHLDIKAILEKAGQGELKTSVEKTLEIHEFQGAQMTGCYFAVTDKSRTIAAPKPGEYLYLTQGYAKTGKLVLSFRLVSNRLVPEQEQMLEMIKTARFVKK